MIMTVIVQLFMFILLYGGVFARLVPDPFVHRKLNAFFDGATTLQAVVTLNGCWFA